MNIFKLLGKTMQEVEEDCFNIVYKNNINCTIELSNVETSINKELCNVLLYFDLIDKSSMNMAIIKIECLTIFQKIKLKNIIHKKVIKGYVPSIVFTSNRIAIITFVKENIIDKLS